MYIHWNIYFQDYRSETVHPTTPTSVFLQPSVILYILIKFGTPDILFISYWPFSELKLQ